MNQLSHNEAATQNLNALAALTLMLEQNRDNMFQEVTLEKDRIHLENRVDHLIYDLNAHQTHLRNNYAVWDEYLSTNTQDEDTERARKVVSVMLENGVIRNHISIGGEYHRDEWGERSQSFEKPSNQKYEAYYLAQVLGAMGILPPNVSRDNLWERIAEEGKHPQVITTQNYTSTMKPEKSIMVIERQSDTDPPYFIGRYVIISDESLGISIGFHLMYDGHSGDPVPGRSRFSLIISTDTLISIAKNESGKIAVVPDPPEIL
ncbi:MAG: hypothetical protein U9Q67_01155 [Patescibacteria group bacterium]|nr:hypothetical protein [Patescibacteria group bacterium]